jgi:hypothetical protein
MKPIGQSDWQAVVKLTIVLTVFVALWIDVSIAQQNSLDDAYTTRAVVTGKDERNRPLGFGHCFEDVLVKVCGDASVAASPSLSQSSGDNRSHTGITDRLAPLGSAR